MADRKYLDDRNTDTWPAWAKNDPRYTRLALLDLYLNGKQYECLGHSFDDETGPGGKYIPMHERRPSTQYNIPGMVARQISRKLFCGKHTPHLTHKNENVLANVQRLLEEAELPKLMPKVVKNGSIGSSCVTFQIVGMNDQARMIATVWDSKFCRPRFNKLRELTLLRICYPAHGSDLLMSGYQTDYKGESIDPRKKYWRIKDLDEVKETDYKPILEPDWDPNDPSSENVKKLVLDEEAEHKLGMVPAHWFVNQAGGSFPDGACTWEDAVKNTISLDYEISQLLRAVNYCGSPQMVIQGELIDDDGEGNLARSPALTLQFEAAVKEGDITTGGGDARLLEMTGQGISVGIALADKVRMWALEQIGCSRPDKNEIGSVVTGKAMELFDEDLVDVVEELRTPYGDYGYLPLAKKMATAASKANHPLMKGLDQKEIDGLGLGWPKMFSPTAQEVLNMSQGMAQGTEAGVIEKDEAQDYLRTNLDLRKTSANRNVDAERSIDGAGATSENKSKDHVPPATV